MTTLRIVLWVLALVIAGGLSAYVASSDYHELNSQPLDVLAYRCGGMYTRHIIPDADELAMEARCEQAHKERAQ